MNVHKNARLTPKGREILVRRIEEEGLREWAYARAYDDSHVRARRLPEWLHRYNWHRPHASLGYRPPMETLNLNNLVAVHS